MSYYVVHHDCEVHTHSCEVFGPFLTGEAANEFIEKHRLFQPIGGGYAFATIVFPGMEDATAPEDYEEWE